MKIIGVTGGIACGKSTLCRWFREHTAYPILDADQISHKILAHDKQVKEQLRAIFGASIFRPCGSEIDRTVLGKIVFSDPKKKKKLESIIHPIVRRKLALSIIWNFFSGSDGVIIEVPLLFESGLRCFFSEIIVVACSREVQLRRLLFRRPDYSEERALAIIDSQMPLELKEKMATWTLFCNREKPFSSKHCQENLSSFYAAALCPSKLATAFWLGLGYLYCILFLLGLFSIISKMSPWLYILY